MTEILFYHLQNQPIERVLQPYSEGSIGGEDAAGDDAVVKQFADDREVYGSATAHAGSLAIGSCELVVRRG